MFTWNTNHAEQICSQVPGQHWLYFRCHGLSGKITVQSWLNASQSFPYMKTAKIEPLAQSENKIFNFRIKWYWFLVRSTLVSETSPHFMKFAAVLHSLFHMLLVFFFFWIMFIMYLYLLVLPYASNKSTNDLDDGKLILLLYFKFPFLNKWIYYTLFFPF